MTGRKPWHLSCSIRRRKITDLSPPAPALVTVTDIRTRQCGLRPGCCLYERAAEPGTEGEADDRDGGRVRERVGGGGRRTSARLRAAPDIGAVEMGSAWSPDQPPTEIYATLYDPRSGKTNPPLKVVANEGFSAFPVLQQVGASLTLVYFDTVAGDRRVFGARVVCAE